MQKYDVVDSKTIGEGGFGKAKLVRTKTEKYINIRNRTLKMPSDLYIMKIMDYDNWASEEAKMLQSLSHPNIVKYIDSFREGNKFHIIMEYAKGGDLEKSIQTFSNTRSYYPEYRVKKWFLQICSAIKYIHSKNILHRDLKPSNIFMESFECLKVGDFGLSKQLNNSSDYTKSYCGTPLYMAPEILKRQPYNKKADIYSLGCILYELLTLQIYMQQFDYLDIVKLPDVANDHYYPDGSIFPAPLVIRYVCNDKWRYLLKLMLSPNPNARPSIEKVIDIVNEINQIEEPNTNCNIC